MKTNFTIEGVKCYMERTEAMEHYDDIVRIDKEISDKLEGTNYDHLDLCDVSAGGIQVRLYNKYIYGFSFGNQFTIKYDWSNIDEVIEDSIKDFNENDTPEHINSYKNFIEDGLKYGWD